MTPQEFAEKIRSKYPEGVASDGRSYAQVPDDELTKLVVAKYPVYASQVKSVQPKRDIIKKAAEISGKIFPGEKVGEALGSSIVGAKALLQGKTLDEATKEMGGQVKPAQVAGDVASATASAAGFAGAGTTGTFLQRFLSNIGLGATISGGETAAKGGDVGDVARSAGIGGAIGGAIPVVGAGLKAIGNQIQQLPARFVNSALSRKKAEVLADISKDKVDDFANYVLESKPVGSANKLLGESVESIDDLGKQIEASLSSAVRKSGSKVTIGRDNLLDEIAKLPEAEGALMKRADVRGVIEKLAPQAKKLLQKNSLTLEEANKLRQLVDKTLGDRAFLGGQLSADKEVLKSFANTLRNTVKDKAPEGTRELFLELSNEIRFRDGLLNKIAQRAGNQVLSFGDFIGGGLGGIFGSLGAQPLTGAIMGVATRRALESVPFKIGAGKVVSALTKAGPFIEQLTPAQQTVILNLFADLFSGEESGQPPREEEQAQETQI